MGFDISWVGFNGISRADGLKRLGMIDTQRVDEANEAPFSLAQLPNNWLILFVNDFEFASDARLARLSKDATVIGCKISEGIMYSDAALFHAGKRVWAISHFGGKDLYDLKIEGTLPPEIEQVRSRLMAEQKAQVQGSPPVDLVFDIPVEAARLVTSYRHDQWKFDWGEPVFNALASSSPSGH